MYVKRTPTGKTQVHLGQVSRSEAKRLRRLAKAARRPVPPADRTDSQPPADTPDHAAAATTAEETTE